MKNIFQKRPQGGGADHQPPRESVGESVSTVDREKALHSSDVVDTPIPLVTWRSLVMGLFVSMGGFVFGYDTGQISGFLEMPNFLQRYGQLGADGAYHFSNVRSGLIVGLVSLLCLKLLAK